MSASRMLGTLNIPVYNSVPPGGIAGQVISVTNQLYTWDGTQWVPLYPMFIQSAAPSTTAAKYLWVNTSGGAGDNATLWVEDGQSLIT